MDATGHIEGHDRSPAQSAGGEAGDGAPDGGPLDTGSVRAWLVGLQDSLCAAFEQDDGLERFRDERWERPGGGGSTRVLQDGAVFEKAAVAFSHLRGPALPPAASARRPDLAGRPFEVMGVSVIVHPRNPFVPAAHLNVRLFVAQADGGAPGAAARPAWWFGGGMDLTPCYGFLEDAVRWHRGARAALEPFGADLYPRFKRACDEYFFLPHRGEPRGVGGLFFDDFAEGGFARSFAVARAVADAFAGGYRAVVARRSSTPCGERERTWQLVRRGRYVEFNLLHDRGTLFGLQSGGRAEAVLVSLPPLVRWTHGFEPAPGSPEAALAEFLRPRDWAELDPSDARGTP